MAPCLPSVCGRDHGVGVRFALSDTSRTASPVRCRSARKSGARYQLTGRGLPSSYPAADWMPTSARSENSARDDAPA